ncbi:GNAT family N-acetyltransferase [Veronia pacifica]|uniref:N-acetyltransferase domain-containing protein n=1 Tax=Veronia pacifica TaxID=1080227 RepID=A0A1C3EAS3_9GAMM|nr:GNAT family N-acetyltransferase [Veronia pacifica]ODA30294.1 hypothetical protein A8L45_20405 [Veronia pacifica]
MSVTLIPMSATEYPVFLESSIKSYAESGVKSGRWTAGEALSQSRQQLTSLLKNGVSTEDQYLLKIIVTETGQNVGHIWLHCPSDKRFCFIYELYISENHRRCGFAQSAMLKAEEFAASKGATKLELHVFNFNKEAQALYQKLGFNTFSLNMRKEITPTHEPNTICNN